MKHRKPCQCDVCERGRWEYPCSDGSHPSFWQTVITSPQWTLWKKEQEKRFHFLNLHKPRVSIGVYDMSEVEECGWISQKHFQDFLKFINKV